MGDVVSHEYTSSRLTTRTLASGYVSRKIFGIRTFAWSLHLNSIAQIRSASDPEVGSTPIEA